MSRIGDLLERLAPDGVWHTELSRVARLSETRTRASQLTPETFVGVDNILPNKRGRVAATYTPNTDVLCAYEPGDVLLGNIRPYLKKIWLATNSGGCSGDVLAIRPDQGILLPRFLYYLLSSDPFFAYTMQHANGAKMPRGSKDATMQYRVPVPPREMQAEIVRILDSFQELEAELEAELVARRTQYAHFRHQLLVKSPGEARELQFGDLGDVRMCKRIFKEDTSTVGEVPFFKIGTFGGVPDSYISQATYESYRNRYPFPRAGSVMLSAAGTIGRAVVYDGRPAYFQDSNIVWIDNDETVVTNRYLLHWCSIAQWSTDGGTIKRLYNENLRRTPILAPDLETQRRIASILDSFDALVNDLSSGLPAEIAARRQQYEHYRDRLLTFREAS